jgi:hypothetical protein
MTRKALRQATQACDLPEHGATASHADMDNFAADRAAADKILKVFPDTPVAARANREFMRRAVRHLADAGID